MVPLDRVLVVGLGLTGQAVVRACIERGVPVVVAEDRPLDPHRQLAEELGFDLVAAPAASELDRLIADASAVLPSPGVPEAHRLFASAARVGRPIISEFDLAAVWDDRPVAAITGTNGKTTVTMMVTAMLRASGLCAEAVGNTETALVAALGDASTDVFVVEASSFRLGHSQYFKPRVGTWLNFAPDHLDVHASLEVYVEAKARIWSDQGPDDLAIANAEDPEVLARSVGLTAERRTFGVTPGSMADYRRDGAMLRGPDQDLVAVEELPRSLPHDMANALAAAATALGVGADIEGVRTVLRSFEGLAHRVEFVAEHEGVRFFNDSKATAPHATATAVSGFDSVVLIAGGKNKGLDLAALAADVSRIRTVVAIGDSADEIERAFAGKRPVSRAGTMAEAVSSAAGVARRGEVVLLSPGCASFDWYGSYGERGDDFKQLVRAWVDTGSVS